MKVLVTGGRGMLGRTILRELTDFEIVPADLPECDITDPAGFDALLGREKPDAVIHCAAVTNVDRCEELRELAFAVNGRGTHNVAQSCRRHGARLIAISTDYVFDNGTGAAADEYADLPPGRTVYGMSKRAGEAAALAACADCTVCRIAWLYGFGGPSFVHTMLRLADGARGEIKVVDDQRGNPTSALAVARGLRGILNRPDVRGVVHMTCEGEASWADFAEEIFRIKGVGRKVRRCTTDEYPRPAPRPKYSCLDNAALRRFGLPPMPHWKDALAEFLSLETDAAFC